MNDEIKRLEAAVIAAVAQRHQANVQLEAAVHARQDQLDEHISLARATLGLLSAIDDHDNFNGYRREAWAFREQLAPLCELYGVRIVEHAEYREQAALEEI